MKYRIPTKNEWRMKDTASSDGCWWWLASLFMAFTLVLIAASCQEEAVQAETVEEGLPATVRLEVMPDATSQAQTRADENAIKDLHVLVYNNRGELIGKGYNNNSPTITVKTRSGSGCTLYAIANTGNAKLFDSGVAATEAKLKTMKTAAIGSWDALTTASHLIMVGSKTGVAINAGSSTLKDGIAVTRMVGKVTLNIGVKTGSGITIKDYQVFSLPRQSNYVPHATTDGATTWINGVLTPVNTTAASKMFFMYENRRGIVSSITNQKDKGEKKAPAYSTYVVINGDAFGYKATWRVYLGENNTSDFNIRRNTPYTITITLSRPGIDGADTRVEVEETYPVMVGGNSNCYMIKPGSAVTIPVERANESFIQLTGSILTNGTYYQLQASTTWTASLVWESSKGLVTLREPMGTGSAGRFKVIATNASIQGNAVVAIKSASNEILWSWHIWVTTYNGGDQFIHNNGKRTFNFMDRALGATSATANELSSCGLYYQWGRKDPFPGIGQEGGSWSMPNSDPIRVYNAVGKPYEITKITVPNITPNNLTNATRKPDTYYYNANDPYDWFVYSASSVQRHDLWSGSPISLSTPAKKSVFDPCPAGWRIPPYLNNTSPYANISGWSWSSYGQNFNRTGGYFPAAGNRHVYSGVIYNVTLSSINWSGSPINTTGSYIFVNSASVHTSDGNSRAYGCTVRCCQDNL